VALNLLEKTHFSTERGMRIMNYIQFFFCVHKRIISAVNRVEFVTDRTAYIILRGRWCDIIVLSVHAPTQDKTDYVKDSFYKVLEHVFNKFPKYHIKIMLGDFNAKVGRKLTNGNERYTKLVMTMWL
jgi:hypothetical protein